MRKVMLLAGVPSLALATVAEAHEKADAPKKPNVVIIVADDLGFGDLGYHGSMIPTPNIDRIASEGIELTHFYSAPVSSPARCGLVTGRYPSRFGIRETVIPPWRDYGLDPEERTIADVLGENGYSNRAIIGKWHMGHSRIEYYPLERGFTHFYGLLNGAFDYFTHEREGELDWHNDWESCYDKGYSTDLIAQEAARCIVEYTPEDPYLLYVCFNAPHSPYEAPEEEIQRFISKEEFDQLKPRQQKGWTYRAMVSRMDKGVGTILAALEKSGEMDNTIVFFMSDNGGVPGMEPFCNNIPLRGSKFEEWDGGVHVPALIWWKDGFRNGRKVDQLTGFVDVLPTIADIIGVKGKPARPYDGISVKNVLTGNTVNISRDIYLGVGAAVGDNYKFIRAGASKRMGLVEDFFTDLSANPSEKDGMRSSNASMEARLRKVVEEGDAIVPVMPEMEYGKDMKGFKAPHEWKVTKHIGE